MFRRVLMCAALIQSDLWNGPVIPDILENSMISMIQNVYKIICQKYENKYRFATLYDTTNKIPVFSAYKYSRKGIFKRPNPTWRIEPGLHDNQAKDSDYRNNNQNMTRGHLFPSSHAPDLITARSTFTLTNAVPEENIFNGGSWNRMEIENKHIMEENCPVENNPNEVLAYVLTGAVHGNTELNMRVNIPSVMWTAFCCYNSKNDSWISKAYWAENIYEIKPHKIHEQSLQDLQHFLRISMHITGSAEVQLFDNNCEKMNRRRRIQNHGSK